MCRRACCLNYQRGMSRVPRVGATFSSRCRQYFGCLDCDSIRRVITRMNHVLRLAVLSCIAMSATWTHADEITDLLTEPATRSALDALRASESELIRDQIR